MMTHPTEDSPRPRVGGKPPPGGAVGGCPRRWRGRSRMSGTLPARPATVPSRGWKPDAGRAASGTARLPARMVTEGRLRSAPLRVPQDTAATGRCECGVLANCSSRQMPDAVPATRGTFQRMAQTQARGCHRSQILRYADRDLARQKPQLRPRTAQPQQAPSADTYPRPRHEWFLTPPRAAHRRDTDVIPTPYRRPTDALSAPEVTP